MGYSRLLVLLALTISQVDMRPQFITMKDGKLGINIAGFHAGIGIGSDNNARGLFAEAGTPFGQSAKAGLGGALDDKGSISGRLYAGASGGANVKASAGLAGSIDSEKSAGGGFASAQAGDRIAFSMMAGKTSAQNSEGFIKTEVQPNDIKVKDENMKGDNNIDSINEVKPLDLIAQNTEIRKNVEAKVDVNEEQQPQVVEKQNIYLNNKARRHNFPKTAFLGGYIGPDGEIVPPALEKTESAHQKKIDVRAEPTVNGDTNANGGVTKIVTYQRNPSFFQDIFNIPISTLKAVGNFLTGTVENTHVSVQKSASVQTESDHKSAKQDPSNVSSSSSHISVETPSASKVIDDILAIPINTLGAVNKFLENNVAGRIQVRREGGEPTRVKLGPHARRRANKRVVIVEDPAHKEIETET